jgi:hypothetical protein
MNPFTNSAVNQLTKAAVIASTLAAAFLQLYLATRLLYPQLFFVVAAAFLVAVAVGAWRPGPMTAVVMALSYLAPAAYVVWAGFENYSFEIVWSLPLLGLLISGRDAWRWSIPAQWRWPLVTWALIVAASWPFVFLREIDFYPGILPLRGVANTSIGITPWDAVMGVTYWSLVHSIGLLWFDRLFGWYANRPIALRAAVLLPLAAAITVACALGAYQAFVDLQFLNPHLWPHMGRASGTLGDANTFGVIAALWAPAAVVLSRTWPAPWSTVGAAGGVAIGMVGVLTSGSRTGLIAIGIGLAAIAVEGLMAWRRTEAAKRPSLKRLAPVAAGLLIVAAVVLVVAKGSSITSVVDRGSLQYLPGFGDVPFAEAAREILWNRYGYGQAAGAMITERPLAGVGVGTFHLLVPDFSMLAIGKKLTPDNAQSWYRHHLAELGVLGSIPWLVWCVVFALALFSKNPAGDRFSIGVLRGGLVGFGVVSLLGMPGQSLPVALTFWTIAFWFATLTGVRTGTATPWPKATWIVTLALVAVHATITLADARGDLRPRNRSMRFGWDYSYGLGRIELDAKGVPERRTSWNYRSLAVNPVKGKVLKFVAWIDHRDGDEHPVHVRVWADSRLVYDGDLKRSAAIFKDIPATPGRTHMVIETEISRLFTPVDFGSDDRRALGLSIRDWVWE